MDERVALPVTLPRPNPTQSYWQRTPSPLAHARTTATLPASAATVIVGSGITGAAVAFNLLRDAGVADVVMLEAREACSGATGRNGGHTKAASYRTFPAHRAAHGAAAAAQIAALELANLRAVHAFAATHGIGCGSRPGPTVDVVYDAARWAADLAAVEAIRAAFPPGHPAAAAYEVLGPEEAARRFRCPAVTSEQEEVRGAIVYEAGSVDAYRFATGVLGLCVARGLNLQTTTPATALAKTADGRWRVQTPRGAILARRVVVATNGYAAQLLPSLQGVVVPLRGTATAQRPGAGMPAAPLGSTYSFVYAGGYDYMVPFSRDNDSNPNNDQGDKGYDIVIGGGLAAGGLAEYGTTDDTAVNETVARALHGALPRYFGAGNWGADDPAGRVRDTWTGIMGYSADALPLVGRMPGDADGDEGLWVAAGFQGHGMALCWMCARALAAMMGGRDDEELRAWFPDVFRVTEARLRGRFRGHALVRVEGGG
ncbi:FAD dependent oxidoreductase [Xylariomycetidae sp. FL0641]|nr:FAD dependent oxidoreductase [Xylariomycetidae sp. FL0641]